MHLPALVHSCVFSKNNALIRGPTCGMVALTRNGATAELASGVVCSVDGLRSEETDRVPI